MDRGCCRAPILGQSKGVAPVGKVRNMPDQPQKILCCFFHRIIKAYVLECICTLHLPPYSYPPLNTPRSILIVDDSQPIRSLVVGVLRQNGYTAYEAESGVAALAEMQLHKAEIGLVLSDVVMPDMDGLTLARQLRKQMPKLPIILLSMHINEDTHWVTEESNFSFLPKPFESKQLLEAVRSFLG